MKMLCVLVLMTGPAVAAPRLVPVRDVTVEYTVQPRDHAPVDVRVEIEGGGAHLRIASEDLPTAFLVNRPAEEATVLLPMLKLYATVGIGTFDPERTVLRQASFERHGQRRVAGLVCTDWTAQSPNGRASGCVTEDGVVLEGQAFDRRGVVGSVRATVVQYGALPPVLFRRPAGYSNAGSLPIGGLGGFGR